MCLFDALARYEYRNSIQIEQYVVYYIWGPEQAAISEAIFTHLANAWAHKGTGFTYHPPGLSNNSVMDMTSRHWLEAAQFMSKGPYEKNIRDQYEKNDKAQQAREEKERRVALLKDQVKTLKAIRENQLSSEAIRLAHKEIALNYRKQLVEEMKTLHNALMENVPGYRELHEAAPDDPVNRD
jgi:hypothetical protein